VSENSLIRRVHFAVVLTGLSAGWIVFDGQSCFAQPPATAIPVWKTIKIGTFGSVIDLREALEASECGLVTPANFTGFPGRAAIPCKLGNSANEIIGRPEFELSRTPNEIQLVIISGKDLGFSPDSQPSLRQIYERAETLGYSLCPPEVGPQLRLQYTNQKIGEFLDIAMSPIRDYAGELTILSVGNGGAGLLLVGRSGNPDAQISASGYFVFMRSSLPTDRAVAREGGDIKRILDKPAAENRRVALPPDSDPPPE
jgi:hypothetical protein